MSKKVKITQKQVRAARALEVVPHPGLKFSHKHHLFIAKAKRGELWALNHLSVPARAAVTPLLEMWPPKIPRKKKNSNKPPKPPKSMVAHVTDILTMIRSDWGALPCALDTRYLLSSGVPSADHLKTVFDIARKLGVVAVPVTSIRFSPAFQDVIKNIIAQDHRGVMIRLLLTDFTDPKLVADYLTALLNVLQIPASEADVLIDLELRREQAAVQTLGASNLASIPNIGDWRTLTLAAGCFPQNITDLDYSKWYPIARSDWLGWLNVVSTRRAENKRIPSYGDYGIRCGGAPKDIPRGPDPNIRYSDKQQIIVRKEKKSDGGMKKICASLIARPDFSGAPFSRGDEYIAATAANSGSAKNGQAEQWIQWCSNHHLELTASQIQSLP
jgi:hypothetical protein